MNWPFSAYDLFAHVASGGSVLAAWALATGRTYDEYSGVVEVAMLSIAAYTLGHIVAQVADVLLESLVARKYLGGPETRLIQSREGLRSRVFPGYFQTLPPDTTRALLSRLEREGGPTEPGRGMFLHCWPIARRDADTRVRLDSFLNLYGFSRNMAVASLISAILLAVGGRDGAESSRLLLASLGLVGVSIVLIYRYLKFFRLYTHEVFVRFARGPEDASSL
jgi:hypothetical protein